MTQSPATPLPPPKERRRLREACSLTQVQVAARMGVSCETVRAWESGRSNPRGGRREAYARLLKLLAEREQEKTGDQEAPEVVEVTACQGAAAGGDARTAVPATAAEDPAAVALGDPVAVRTEDPTPVPEPRPERPLTPAQAFDALYAFCAPALVRQTFLLTGRRELARESVERAFQVAWQRWPEVARDRDPAGWVRATAYDFALSPWHRFRPRYRHPEPPPSDASDRALLDVLLTLPPPQRRTLLLYDGVGLDLPETAAETEATTPAAANRLLHARAAVAARLPGLSDPTELHHRLAELASTERLRAPRPATVRDGSERRARFWTRAAIAFTVALIGTTALTLRTAPTRYEPPVPPGETVLGVPPKVAPGPLSEQERELRAKLRSEMQNGPERVLPQAR
ncbi:DNA-directed RNA polymerase specialized sigma24 family protein/transcriptional regulator with XRE-family HTH domain [Streptomyces sp. V4I8]|uniref:helix-turn-helix domain-containing protein n=1 Tax=Streptomyces sp. V4I8 TaxID=3156469 RepID=UPI00351923B8